MEVKPGKTTPGGEVRPGILTPSRLTAAMHSAADAFNGKASIARANARPSREGVSTSSGKFQPERLPQPLDFYEQQQGLKLRGSGEWRMTHCVFHDDKHASLSINIRTGAYRCHGCNAKGGDVLAFYRERTGKTFKEAAEMLGAWEWNHG